MHDKTEKIVREAFEIIEAVELKTGERRDSESASARLSELAAEMALIPHKRCKKLSTWLKNQSVGLCAWINGFNHGLDTITDEAQESRAVCLMAWLWRLDRELSLPCNRYRRAELRKLRIIATQRLESLTLHENRLEELVVATAKVIRHRRRASSLVECFNSVLRPWLEAHKRVTQGALDLFAAWWNLRIRTIGKLKGTSAYTALTGISCQDWLTKIGCPTSERWN